MIAIIDYGMGNLQSVANGLEAIGSEFTLSSDPSVLKEAAGIILPGVGAFGEGMAGLRSRGLIDMLNEEVIEKKKPYLGICLGLQFLAKKGYEEGEHEGLGWLDGEVTLLEPDDQSYKVPHMGWNAIDIVQESPIFSGLHNENVFYFVHSFALTLSSAEESVITATADYGGSVIAAIQKDNIFATQFHPEKSQTAGLKILKNFTDYCISC